MSDTRYKIVFTGELMPAAALDAVKDNLARLFKSERNKIDALFTGNPVALKRDLNEDEANKYIGALQNAGAKVHKEQDLAASLSLVETDDHRTTPLEETARMSCPKCGHEQVKAIDCSACGIVIEKYLARQALLAEEAAAAPAPAPAPTPEPAASAPPASSLMATLAAADARANSPYATPLAQVADGGDAIGELSYFGLQGRIGRVRYLGWLMGVWLLNALIGGALGGVAAVMAQSELLHSAVTVISVVAWIALLVFFTAKRLHDIGWSAWFDLILLVPGINLLFILLLLILPGTAGANRYGAQPPRNGKGLIVLACIMPLIVVGTLTAVAIPAYQQYRLRALEAAQHSPQPVAPAEAVAPAAAGAPAETVEPSEE
ncbi:uncharacterized membrane protein YhaH (DUF805 family)/DNA-directed RNA polymerase subunit M/transcription elongation factor TFIIS [Pseudomonas sp. TE3786]